MEQYLGKKRVIVVKRKYLKLDGTVSSYISSGILNIPEEEPGVLFWIRKTNNGFVMETKNNGGRKCKTRKSAIQTVITVGRIEDESTNYKCYKTDRGYKFEKMPEGVGNGENVLFLHSDNRGRHYFCLPIRFMNYLKLEKGDYLKIKTEFKDEFEITIEKAKEAGIEKNELYSRTGYACYDGKNKSLSICKRAEKFLEGCETLVILKSRGKLKILKLMV